jgi:hypothetical protein
VMFPVGTPVVGFAKASASSPVLLQLRADANFLVRRPAVFYFWTSLAVVPQNRQQTAASQRATTTTQTVSRPAMVWVHVMEA